MNIIEIASDPNLDAYLHAGLYPMICNVAMGQSLPFLKPAAKRVKNHSLLLPIAAA